MVGERDEVTEHANACLADLGIVASLVCRQRVIPSRPHRHRITQAEPESGHSCRKRLGFVVVGRGCPAPKREVQDAPGGVGLACHVFPERGARRGDFSSQRLSMAWTRDAVIVQEAADNRIELVEDDAWHQHVGSVVLGRRPSVGAETRAANGPCPPGGCTSIDEIAPRQSREVRDAGACRARDGRRRATGRRAVGALTDREPLAERVRTTRC